MEQYRKISNERQINYNVVNLIKEHAKKYQYMSDKKDFLRKVSALEQKYILLESLRPYEVLCYLEELDLKSSKLVLSELNSDEIRNILLKFSADDKKDFYERFSYLELVNQFIQYDKNAEEHVDDLSFDRKIDLLDSSSEETVLASSKIYDSMSEQEKEVAETKISTSDGITALYESTAYEEKEETKIPTTIKEEVQNKQFQQKKEEQKAEIQKEQPKEEEPKEEEQKEEIQKEQPKEEQKEEIIDQVDKYSIIGNGQTSVSIVSNPGIIKEFNEKEKQAEEMELNKMLQITKTNTIKKIVENSINDVNQDNLEMQKTL